MSQLQSVLILLGRILMGVPALIFGIMVIIYWSEFSQVLAEQHIPVTWVWILVSIIFLILGSVSIIIGYKTRIGTVLLMLVIIGASFTIDGFWDPNRPQTPPDPWVLGNNLAIFGGLCYILAFGSGTISLDKRERKKEIL